MSTHHPYTSSSTTPHLSILEHYIIHQIKLSLFNAMPPKPEKRGKKKRKEKGNLNKKKACIEERKKNRRGKGKFGQLLIYDGE